MASQLRTTKRTRPEPLGRHIDTMRGQIIDMIKQCEQEHDRIVALGCDALNGPHFKTGTRKMFFNRPADATGARRSVYVGTSADRQAEYLARQHRERVRSDLAALHDRLAHKLDRLEYDLASLHADFGRAANRMQEDIDNAIDADNTYGVTLFDNPAPCPDCGNTARRQLSGAAVRITICDECNHVEHN